ncbi:MAG: N-acetylmuramoyl-L-alanine amidase, partial [Candidatus Elarobacter sp.]
MNSRAHRFSAALAAVVLMLSAGALPAPAQERAPALWFQGTRLILDHAVPMQGDLGVSTSDPGLHRFLDRLGATVAYSPSERYVVITTQDRRTIVFTLGDPAYTVAGVRARAPFAPLASGNDAVLPFYALARALYVEPVADGGETVLQPRVGALDVRTDGPRTVITIRAAMPLVTAGSADGPDRLQVSFVGQGSSLTASRKTPGTAVDGIDVAVAGSARVPTTTVTIVAARGATHRIVPAGSADAFAVVFESRVAADSGAPPPAEPAQTSDAAAPPATASPAAAPLVVAGRATVTDVTIEPGANDALAVRIALSGAVGYEWHRLLDNRWYIDFRETTLNGPGRDEHPSFGAVQSVRVRQIGTTDAPVVRVAFTLSGQQRIDLAPSEAGVVITVGTDSSTDVVRTGVGRTGGAAVVPSAVAVDPNAPGEPADAAPPGWKYGANTNSRLIVIDPGHGGADTGTAHNGLVEKDLTFDIAQRLRSLLVAQGWTVKLTRDTDIDPVSNENLARMHADGRPNADDRAYLQTRCDVANNAGARLFISIHVNSAPSTSPHGTTFYWYKPQDASFAQTLERN